MTDKPKGVPTVRPPTLNDFRGALGKGIADFKAAPLIGLFFAGFYVVAGLLMSWVTYLSGNTFWLVLAVMGFPLIGAFAAVGLYETSRRRNLGEALDLDSIAGVVLSQRSGQLPYFATMIVVLLLFWFFIGHMIFAVFLGLSQMTNIFTGPEVYLSGQGLRMIGFGSLIGAGFATLTFAMSVLGIPMLLDRDVDFVSAFLCSIGAVAAAPKPYLLWGATIATVTFLALVPFFLGLFVVLPVLGHSTWHLYKAVTLEASQGEQERLL